ncbi:EPL1 domain-containing protein [Heracleum sosnowskyi]|uniref:Enhancer of polycomb-like protein n=1 Tax=Heracleum sosnowskyi TaxID=360622 RepID=A0AAD8HYJ1_9APIA|nr:EPL1 domain-containing protein [Heracleum sosnowskyi]
MENNLEKESDVGVSKKDGCTDDQSVFRGSRKGKSGVGDGVKKRKNGGDVGWSEIEPEVKRSRSGFGDGGMSSLADSDAPCVETGQKLNGSCELSGFSLSLDGDGNDIRVPRKQRGSGGIKNRVKKPLSGSCSSVDQIAELNSDFKCSTTNTKSLSRNGKKCDKVNGGDGSSRKGRNYGKKRKGLESGSVEDEEKAKPAVDQGRCINKYSQGDEENLEQNAARMLSSRFDPRCTTFSRGKTVSSHSGGESGSHTGNLQGGFDCPSADNDSRILRPRYDYKGKGCPRKRRHFYEIVYREKDAQWFLKKRIKVFWPLDEMWYHGIVNDYDEERKLHHVKYDDRDKEWICLQNERFMLLLLRSELTDVERSLHSGNDKLIDKIGKDLKMNEVETNTEIHIDSEPIISWLAHSSSRAKSSSGLKKQKTSHTSPIDLPKSSRNISNTHRNSNICLLGKETHKVCSNKSADRLADEANGRESVLDQFSSVKENGSPIVYYRRRFCKKTASSLEAFSNFSSSCRPVDSNGQRSLISAYEKFRILDKKNVCSHDLDSDKLMWSIGGDGLLKLNPAFLPFKEFVTQLSLPVRPPLDFSIVSYETFCSLHFLLMRESGSIVTTWPNVYLEILFVDNEVGLRFFRIEGCLKQAVAFVTLILTAFCEPNQLRESFDLQIPETTIRFKLSCIQDLRKQHVFSFYSFSKLNHSHWLYLDSIFQKHCSYSKKLPLTECTLENIKVLEDRSKHMPSDICESSFRGTKSFQNSIPFGLSKPGNRYVRQSLDNNARHPVIPFALSFSAAPPFFHCLHLNLLMKSSIASVRLRECSFACSLEHQGNTDKSTPNDQVSEQCSVEVGPGTSGTSLSHEELCFGCIPCSKAQLGTNPSTAGVNCDRMISSIHFKNQNSGRTETNVIGKSQNLECYNMESEKIFTKTKMLTSLNQACPVISGDSNYHSLSSTSVDIPATDTSESNVDGKWPGVQRASDFTFNINNEIVFSPDTSGPRSLWTSNKRNRSSLPLGETSPVLHGGQTNDINNVSSNGRRKARTQVHYALPFGGSEFSSTYKPINSNCHPFRRIRQASEKRKPDGFKGSLRNLELLACDANVLITQGDRGWREPGGRVVLELAYHNEWRLAVKFYGSTKYSHKVDRVFLPGSTNRHTHAMMWKGGKDWALEFPDRSQWMLFKEMHVECYNRNIHVSSVKNIPIPGVRLVEEFEDNSTDYLFTRSSARYIRQFETDFDMAMNPSKIFYDMDSEDELWILRNEKSLQTQDSNVVITDETFEKTMDILEKFAYAQQCDHFTFDEIEKVMAGVAPTEMIRAIYQHWQHKRKRIGMPLIRHLQPPSWERYQQKVQEWNQLMAKGNSITSCGSKRKAPSVEKPIMFAFCLKPRGLEVPNKGPKYRSQKKYRVSGHAVVRDQDRVHTHARRFNSFAVGDEKATNFDVSPENSDNFSMLQTSTSSPEYVSLDNDASDFDYYPKPCKNKSKKIGALMPLGSVHVQPSYTQRTPGKRNGVQQQNMYLPDWPSQKHRQAEVYPRHEIMELGVQDLDEFEGRKASGAAKRASIIARLKKNKAQELLSRADFAMQVAVSAIMAADAVKASYDPSN